MSINLGDEERGNLNYRYDPVGRLLEAHSPLGSETFAFDPASNLVDPQAPQGLAASRERVKVHGIPAVLDNLLRDYAGTHFDYDSRGNMVRSVHHGQVTHLRWSAGNQLLEVTEPGIRTTRYHYDPLERRITKHSAAGQPPRRRRHANGPLGRDPVRLGRRPDGLGGRLRPAPDRALRLRARQLRAAAPGQQPE